MMSEQSPEFATAAKQFRGQLLMLRSDHQQAGATTIAAVHIIENAMVGYMSVEQLFEILYGDKDGAQFWEAECSEPISFGTMVRLLAATRDLPTDASSPQLIAQIDMVELAISSALLTGYQSRPGGKEVFLGDTSALEKIEYGRQIPSNLKVHLSKVANVLLDMPRRRHLVPPSLARYISGCCVTMPAVGLEAMRPESAKSGAPGRPTSMHLVKAEMQRRHQECLMLPTITAESDALAVWLEKTHPSAPRLMSKSIRNKMSPKYRSLKRPKL